MGILEQINRSFGAWYVSIFGRDEDVRPRDIFELIRQTMEDHRKEGFDNRVYVPNHYLVEISPKDDEERDYLLSFLDNTELKSTIQRYCRQHQYYVRGELEVAIRELTEEEKEEGNPPRLRVRCRYGKQLKTTQSEEDPHTVLAVSSEGSEESHTVFSIFPASIEVNLAGKAPYLFPLKRAITKIGRSQRADNDLVLEGNAQASKQHARIDRTPEGGFLLQDSGSTNGTFVNGKRVNSVLLQPGDEIRIGSALLKFQCEIANNRLPVSPGGVFGGAAADLNEIPVESKPDLSRIQILNSEGVVSDEYRIASETLIGRGITNDIVLADRSVSVKHARIIRKSGQFLLEALDPDSLPILNDREAPFESSEPLKSGDMIRIGSFTLRFV